MATKIKRTVLRSSTGKKLYAVRNPKGEFKDIRSYARAQRADIAASAKSETSKKSRLALEKKAVIPKEKPVVKKPVVKKAAAKKAPRKSAK